MNYPRLTMTTSVIRRQDTQKKTIIKLYKIKIILESKKILIDIFMLRGLKKKKNKIYSIHKMQQVYLDIYHKYENILIF